MQKWDLQPARDLGMPASERLRSLQRESGLVSTGLHLAWWSLVRGYLAVWHRLAIWGQENIPVQPPFVLVANHTSHLDALVLAAPLPWRLRDRIFPIAAGDVFFQTPLVSAFAVGMLNALPMWRRKCGPHALEKLRQRLLEEPCSYILFPEGTRSRDGQLSPFKPGLGMLVAQTNVPVVPCYLDGCYQALTPNQRWPRPRRIRLHIGDPLTFAAVANNREGWLHIATTTEQRVKALASLSLQN
jgi:1-acyl-sn-glycerol-3-phosphate acyltransferase